MLAFGTAQLDRVGIPSRFMDLWAALVAGLVWHQVANEPGGDRSARLVDGIVDMFLTHVNKHTT